MKYCTDFSQTLKNLLSRVTSILVLMMVINSCSKDKMIATTASDLYELDKSVYFTINIAGVSHTSNAYRLKSGVSYYLFPLVYENHFNEPSGEIQVISFSVAAAVNLPESFKLGTCNAEFAVKRQGDIFGSYTTLHNPIRRNQIWIHNGKSYNILDNGLEFTVSYISYPNTLDEIIEGSFKCNLQEISGSTAIVPATGKFKMKML